MSKYETIFLIALMITGSFTTWCLTREKPDKSENAAMVAEVEQLSQKMERLIETERRRVPSYMAYTPPPMIVQGVQWEADLHVRLQYLRWQIEFFVMLNNLEQKQRGHRIGQGVGQIIGDSKG